MYGKLKIRRHTTGSSLKPKFAVIIVGHAPLGPVKSRLLADHAIGGFPYAKSIDRAVQPIVHAPIHKCLLVLYVARPAIFIGEEFFLVGNPIAIGIGVFINIVGIGLHGEYAVFSIR